MKKTLIVFFALGMVFQSGFAQLSTRENDQTTLKLGTRPGAGDMALTFGMNIFKGSVAPLYDVNGLNPGDLLTFKRYSSSDFALRLGVKLYKTSDKAKGEEFENNQNVPAPVPGLSIFKYKETESEYYLVPGIEKHYLKSNIFDVYTGADILLGYGKTLGIGEREASDNTFNNTKTSTGRIILGLGGIVGVNVFIAQLPISLGIEYGLSLKYMKQGKTKVVNESTANGTVEYATYTGPLTTVNTATGQFNKLSASSFGMDTNQNVRLVLNVYFGK